MKKVLIVAMAVIMVFVFTMVSYAESTFDLETIFQNMEIAELEEAIGLLQGILNDKKVANATLAIEPAESTIATGKAEKLAVSSDGREITSATQISFETSDESVAALKGDTVTGKGAGTATITATAVFEDGAILKATSTVTVIVPVNSLKPSANNLTILAGNEADIASMISVDPENATEKGLLFTSEDESIAVIDQTGKLTGIKAGKVNVIITSAENTEAPKSTKIAVSVNQAVGSIELNVNEFDVGRDNKYKLETTISPEDATDKSLLWESEDPTIATVSRDGTVTGVGTGTTTIKCTANDGSGISASANVTVITAIKKLTLNSKELIITKGNTENIGITMVPADPTNPTLQWSSSDESIATIDKDGLLTAKAVGQCTITVSTTDGTDINVSLPVYVEPTNPVVIESISWRTSWGRRTGKMAVYATSKCNKRVIKSFEYTVFCVKETEYYGSIPMKSGWTTELTFTKRLNPGQELEGAMENVSGFGAVDTVEITPTRVTYADGTVEDIPSDAQHTSTFSVY